MEKIGNLQVKNLLTKPKRKVTLKELHKVGVYMAEKLQDTKHLTMYFRLVKYEEHEILMRAFSYALASNSSNKVAIFLSKLKEYKENSKFRAFIGIMFKDSLKTIEPIFSNIKEEYKHILKDCKLKWVEPKNLHLTLYFIGNINGVVFSRFTRIVYKLREKYGDTVVLTPSKIKLIMSDNKSFGNNKNNKNMQQGYLWLTDFNNVVYRYYFGMRKLIREDKKLKDYIPKAKYFPHITLARIKKCDTKENKLIKGPKDENIDLLLEGKFALITSKLTNKGPVYKIHATY